MADATSEDDREASTLPSCLGRFQPHSGGCALMKSEQRLKSALWFAIGQIVDEESMRRNINATPQFIGALTELVWTQIENVAIDLESFSHHASRATVTTADVLLLARKNPDLQQLMEAFVEERKAGAAGANRRGTGAGRGRGRARPA
ncbi:Centromere protein S [Tolypocladium capitatum]|uniref:Centromere protein S n=1 Tax=Tolypocladium capitatum TaxID=45235 RepID=A0A2K3QCZ9_9HYPO|nr:Centromere protein S [Tolypocladium capitatum]